MTFSGDKLTDLQPMKPRNSPYITVNVGDFTAHLDENKELTSLEAGEIINKEIMKNWENNHYFRDFSPDDGNSLTNKTQYKLLLRGHQEESSSSLMQFFSAITFLLIPATTETSYHLIYELEDVQTGKKYHIVIADNISTMTWLLFFPALPFSSIGANNTYQRIAEHVYQAFVKQGAFLPPESTSTIPSK